MTGAKCTQDLRDENAQQHRQRALHQGEGRVSMDNLKDSRPIFIVLELKIPSVMNMYYKSPLLIAFSDTNA